MASVKTLEIIRKYAEAYKNFYGLYPEITENKGWIKVGERRSVRPSKLNALADILINHTSFKANNDEWNVDEIKNEFMKDDSWKKYIKKNIFESFMSKLYKECGYNSLYMEKIMKEYSLGNKPFLLNDSKIKQIKKRMQEREKELYYARMALEKADKKIKELKKNMNTLKKNSVLFSMDDFVMEDEKGEFINEI